MLAEAGQSLYDKNPAELTAKRYEGICLCLLDLKEFEETEVWCDRLAVQYPGELEAFTCRLKLYFMENEKDRFFQVLDELKKSDVVIDSETLELIRVFS